MYIASFSYISGMNINIHHVSVSDTYIKTLPLYSAYRSMA